MMAKINLFTKFFSKDELARNSLVMFAATTFAGIFNYLYQVYMGRVMGPEEYGVFGALFAIFYMIGVISQTLGTSAASFVSRITGEGKHISFFLSGSLKRMALMGLVVSIIFIASSSGLTSLLNLPDRRPVLVLAPILFLTWVSPISSGALRGVKRFFALGFVNVSNAIFKLVFGVLLVFLGFGVSGALMGVAAGMLAALVISFVFLKPYFGHNNPDEREFRFTTFYSYSLPVMLAMIAFSVPANLDVVLAKYFFSATDAGLYTSASVLGKIIFFFPAGIYAVMFPMIAEKHARGEDTTGILRKSLLYTALLSGSVALGYLLFPQLVMKIFGASYAAALPLVAPYGFAMFFFSLTVIVMQYHLAIKNMWYVALFAGATFIEVLLLVVFNSSIQQMVEVLLIANLSILLVSLLYTQRWKNDICYSTDV
jgi:O-antigen/teichoic acid export membrane protein